MKGRRPFKSRLKMRFWAAVTAVSFGAGAGGIEMLPRDRDTDVQKVTTWRTPDGQKQGVNISVVDFFWKQSLGMKSAAELQAQLIDDARAGDSWRVRAIMADARVNKTDAAVEALAQAAVRGHADVVAALIESGVPVEAQNSRAFLSALEGGHLALAQSLYDMQTAPMTPDALNTGLYNAARAGALGLCNQLIMNGADVSALHSRALLGAVESNDAAIVARILQETVSVGTYYWAGPSDVGMAMDGMMRDNPLLDLPAILEQGCILQGDEYYVETGRATKADVNAGNGLALYRAVQNDNLAIVELLMDKGANPDLLNGAIRKEANRMNNSQILNVLDGKPAGMPSFHMPAFNQPRPGGPF